MKLVRFRNVREMRDLQNHFPTFLSLFLRDDEQQLIDERRLENEAEKIPHARQQDVERRADS